MGGENVLGVVPIINAAGPLTRLGGMPLDAEVADAMAKAAQECVRIEDAHAAAGAYLASITGAESGYVVSGAAAGLTMSAAACIARLDVAAMDQLPDTTGLPNEIIVQRAHMTAYSHALRVAGSRLVDVGYVGYPGRGITWPWQIEAAISERTAALFYSVGSEPGTVSLEQLVEIGQRNNLPVIVDAAATLPPRENLTRFISIGADLVTYSGGKAIGGPQASGILVGRKHLIESVALQSQDMDVYPRTWTLRDEYLGSGRLPGPPHHGLGRSMKVGFEEIIGLVVALHRFVKRDPAVERQEQIAQLEQINESLNGLPGVHCEFVDESIAPRAYPTLLIELDKTNRLTAEAVVNLLVEGAPPIAVSQNFLDRNAIAVIASALRGDQAAVVADRLRALLVSACNG